MEAVCCSEALTSFYKSTRRYYQQVVALVIELNVRGFKPGRGQWILMAIKIRSTTFFGGEVKPSVPCRKFLRLVKDPYHVKETVVGIIHGHFSPSFSLLLGVSAGYC
jgi:hypothetical protein